MNVSIFRKKAFAEVSKLKSVLLGEGGLWSSDQQSRRRKQREMRAHKGPREAASGDPSHASASPAVPRAAAQTLERQKDPPVSPCGEHGPTTLRFRTLASEL